MHVCVCVMVCVYDIVSLQSSVNQTAVLWVATAMPAGSVTAMLAGEGGSVLSAYQIWDAVSTLYIHPASNIHHNIYILLVIYTILVHVNHVTVLRHVTSFWSQFPLLISFCPCMALLNLICSCCGGLLLAARRVPLPGRIHWSLMPNR